MSKKKYLKQIESFMKRIDEHVLKINKEKSKYAPNLERIEYWEKEIENYKNEMQKSAKRMERE